MEAIGDEMVDLSSVAHTRLRLALGWQTGLAAPRGGKKSNSEVTKRHTNRPRYPKGSGTVTVGCRAAEEAD